MTSTSSVALNPQCYFMFFSAFLILKQHLELSCSKSLHLKILLVFPLNARDCDRALRIPTWKSIQISSRIDTFVSSSLRPCLNHLPIGFHHHCSSEIVLSKVANGFLDPKSSSFFFLNLIFGLFSWMLPMISLFQNQVFF